MISFILKSFGKINLPTTLEREVRAMQDTIKPVDVQNLMILSDNTEDPIRIGDKEIQIHSIPEWLLQRPGYTQD
jgi:hypothetical protein